MPISPVTHARFEFHVSRTARDTYQFEEAFFSLSGNVILANFLAAREFAKRMNDKRDLINNPEKAVRASDINAMGLIDEILHALIEYYREEINPGAIERAAKTVAQAIGEEKLDQLLVEFNQDFPPTSVYRGEQTIEEYLAGETEGYPNRLATVEEIIMLWLANKNPAYRSYLELFDDRRLSLVTEYSKVFPLLKAYFETQPKLENQNLMDVLEEPARNSPDSLSGQLEFLVRRWRNVIGSRFLLRVLGSLDFIREESKVVFGTGGGDGAQVSVYEFDLAALEPEQFSPDRDWMPSVVLIAKNAYVWLYQLSKQYGRSITRLDEIPDDELDRLQMLGFSGLWLIGLWERSTASQRIKQLCGNPEAVASAYSLYDYVIADDLGGEAAYENLRERAWRRGIRLAADMVPNHVGIYSKWVVEHPDWFISLDHKPYPNYSFNGPNLSEDDRVGIYIEDHYYSRNDAAVVFKRVDNWTGSEKYIYHGNDGTSMPWNDTAQLNYLLPEVREAVIQTILYVARKFSVIRFDAAMTLAKKHYQRLWFPEPGTGGDIPTRAEHGLTKEQFDAAMPVEFWREVVDRVAQEVPDTLLLAEAFWLMEGYFVRTLGMHRVYNSAFMNMLRDEKNAEYRLVIKNTLEFDPEILKRYVNFMNNPDERTAVDQFGKGDKYFGIVAMMSTMPGLPMFGHGQIEGFTEKYGMEYKKAYWDEQVEQGLVERHAREIAPLLHKRYRFAGVENFLLFDFYTTDGYVNEDVFAYSNRAGNEKTLVIYHNRFADTRGWIHISSAFAVKTDGGDDKELVQKSLAEGLDITPGGDRYTILRDQRNGLEYIRHNQELFERGLYFELGAYEYHVFTDIYEVQDNEWQHYRQLADALAGRGVPNINEALREQFLQPIHGPFREVVNAGQLEWIISNIQAEAEHSDPAVVFETVFAEVETKCLNLYQAVKNYSSAETEIEKNAANARTELETASKYFNGQFEEAEFDPDIKPVLEIIQAGFEHKDYFAWGILIVWSIIRQLDAINGDDELPPGAQVHSWMEELMLKKLVRNAFRDAGYNENQAWRSVSLLSILLHYHALLPSNTGQTAESLLNTWLKDEEIRQFLAVNRYQDVLWYNKEALEMLLWGFSSTAAMTLLSEGSQESSAELITIGEEIDRIRQAIEPSEYQVDKLMKRFAKSEDKAV